jgi:predicted phosphodiesterase
MIKVGKFRSLLDEATSINQNAKPWVDITGPILAVGDIHGDLDSMLKAQKLAEEHNVKHTVFIGDFVDRGTKQVEVLVEILKSITEARNNIFLRGNHEDIYISSKYGFQKELKKFNMEYLFDDIGDFFSSMPIVARIKEKVLMAHGGIPYFNQPFKIETIFKPGPQISTSDSAFGFLWNDPIEFDYSNSENPNIEKFGHNLRGQGVYSYTQKAVDEFCKFNETKMLIRAHIALREGFKQCNSQVISLFSAASGLYSSFQPKYLLFHDINKFEILS